MKQWLLFPCALLAACTPDLPAAPQVPVAMPDGAIILTGENGRGLFLQCSRGAPEPKPGSWQVAAADIVALEQALPAAMPVLLAKVRPLGAKAEPPFAVHDEARAALLRAPAGFVRQYVGYLQDGRRMVYGNFSPRERAENGRPDQTPTDVCDGGPVYFGVVYDAAARRVTDMDFNGGF